MKEEIKAFLNNRRISQAIVGQVTGTLNAFSLAMEKKSVWNKVFCILKPFNLYSFTVHSQGINYFLC